MLSRSKRLWRSPKGRLLVLVERMPLGLVTKFDTQPGDEVMLRVATN